MRNSFKFSLGEAKMKVTKLAIALLAATGLSAITTPEKAYEAID
jgi:hypothetical protein